MKPKLDFTGGNNSWFDLWHTHIDFDGEGNKSPELRKIYLNKLLTTFIELKSELRDYPYKFQIWILLNENDSSEDGVYIHTKNPNEDNFPLKITSDNNYQPNNTVIKEFIAQTGLRSISVNHNENIYFYLYDDTFGETLL
ncbi:hypothetical protein [Flavobacterium suzhouense]|uniref:Uncharacterized protein n=1 Tax=Flavobacterium suzhouense TaxID=1529638 RepID=A0ABW5NSA5_9FLAO